MRLRGAIRAVETGIYEPEECKICMLRFEWGVSGLGKEEKDTKEIALPAEG